MKVVEYGPKVVIFIPMMKALIVINQLWSAATICYEIDGAY